MNQLANAIQSAGLSGTAAEIVTAFDADVDLPYNHDRWTYAGVASQFGPAAAEGLSAAMTAAGLTTAVISYATVGFDLSLDATRTNLDAIAAGVPDLAAVCATLKAIGRPTAKLWAKSGLSALPTEEAVTEALTQVAAFQWGAHVINDVIQPMMAAGNTIVEIKSAVAGA